MVGVVSRMREALHKMVVLWQMVRLFVWEALVARGLASERSRDEVGFPFPGQRASILAESYSNPDS